MMTDNFAHRAAEWDNPSKTEMTKIFVEELKRKIVINKQWKALEVGAGTGLVGFQLLPYVNSIVFEDTSAAMLDVLKSKITTENNIEIVHGEVQQYQKQDVDLVFSCMAFHHIEDSYATINHLYSITTNDGVVVIGDLVTEDGSFHHFEPIPHKGFDVAELKAKFIKAGFSDVKAHVYNTLKRERIPGVIGEYDQFILIAKK